MQKNDLIFMISTASSSVLANGLIPLSTISRRRGCTFDTGTNSIILKRPGYYKISGTITFTAPVAGLVNINTQKNGVSIPGITTSGTVTTATTEVNTLPIEGIVRVFCNDGIATLTLVNTGVAITVSNVNLAIEYLG
jgi:hypothetical protein